MASAAQPNLAAAQCTLKSLPIPSNRSFLLRSQTWLGLPEHAHVQGSCAALPVLARPPAERHRLPPSHSGMETWPAPSSSDARQLRLPIKVCHAMQLARSITIAHPGGTMGRRVRRCATWSTKNAASAAHAARRMRSPTGWHPARNTLGKPPPVLSRLVCVCNSR